MFCGFILVISTSFLSFMFMLFETVSQPMQIFKKYQHINESSHYATLVFLFGTITASVIYLLVETVQKVIMTIDLMNLCLNFCLMFHLIVDLCFSLISSCKFNLLVFFAACFTYIFQIRRLQLFYSLF